MVIAVNTRFLLEGYLEGYGNFIYETFQRITAQHPEHQFIFIFDRPYDQRFVQGENIKAVVTGPAARHPLLWKFWYDVRIPAILKKYKADVFVSMDGFCSLHTKIPQCLVVHDLAFLHYPSAIRRSHLLYYKRYTPKFMAKANSIATVSQFSKRDIAEQYKTDPERIDVVYSGVKDLFAPLTEEEKINTKNRYTEGKEYFVYTGSIHPRKNLIRLLKAFSLFKKRQQTNMKLVLAGRLAWKYESFREDLKSYKYRDDVVMTGYVDDTELASITGAAWGMVYPSLWEGFGVPVLEAMRCDVPVITSSGSPMEEIAKDAALYIDPADHTTIAEKMMLLYKDENLRKEMIRKGRAIAGEYSWEKTAALLWQSILKATGNKAEE
ncbi:MAG TPA: glycosyltransferase family 1 protein [Chitinophagaceae bacterium]|jgi:glycosyltransferase involved in cell wall biosynthesis|nr:glycosyltransferase family 1 protein [Chitinophagaceae bacterium]